MNYFSWKTKWWISHIWDKKVARYFIVARPMMKLELVIFINKYIVQLYLNFDYLIRALRTIIHLSTKWQYWFCNKPWHRALRALGLSSCMMATLLLVPAVSVLMYSQLVVFRRRVLTTLYADLKGPDNCKRVIACPACALGPYTSIADRTCYQWETGGGNKYIVHFALCALLYIRKWQYFSVVR